MREKRKKGKRKERKKGRKGKREKGQGKKTEKANRRKNEEDEAGCCLSVSDRDRDLTACSLSLLLLLYSSPTSTSSPKPLPGERFSTLLLQRQRLWLLLRLWQLPTTFFIRPANLTNAQTHFFSRIIRPPLVNDCRGRNGRLIVIPSLGYVLCWF